MRKIPPWSFKQTSCIPIPPPGSHASNETGSPASSRLVFSDYAAWQQTQERVADAESLVMHGAAFKRRCISPLPSLECGANRSRDNAALSLPLHERCASTVSSLTADLNLNDRSWVGLSGKRLASLDHSHNVHSCPSDFSVQVYGRHTRESVSKYPHLGHLTLPMLRSCMLM